MDNSLNENPVMPDTSKMQNNLNGITSKVPIVSITNVIIKAGENSTGTSLEEQLEKAIKDTTLGL